ncbi:toll/interleukin-1 receptor domain-containing protein [Streptomyces rubiginosohelvolus]|uniref:toll/interleukin-1 receptor domain-containing protein n=1 Tax=Streptomyces rubiginosohelvolus TaxID=67362 RepID=UPI0035DD2D7D
MKVFLSWSGDRSKAMAEFLRIWLPDVIQAVNPWISSRNISQGSRPLANIADELASSNFGIVCVTPENRGSEWINFEAGALSKTLEDSVVVPLLLGIDKAQVTGPLAQFQMTVSTVKDEVYKLVSDMNDKLGEAALAGDRLERSFEQNWPSFSEEFEKISLSTNPQEPKVEEGRSDSDLLEEVLLLARRQERRLVDVESSVQSLMRIREQGFRKERKVVAGSESRNRNVTQEIMANVIGLMLHKYEVLSAHFDDGAAWVGLEKMPIEGEDGFEEFQDTMVLLAEELKITVTAESPTGRYTHHV